MPAYDKKLLIDVYLALRVGEALQKEVKSNELLKMDVKQQKFSRLNLQQLEEFHEKYGSQKLLRECYPLLHKIKCALINPSFSSSQNYSSSQNHFFQSPAATQFLDLVNLIERQPIWQTVHDHKVHKKIKQTWQKFNPKKDKPVDWLLFREQFSAYLHYRENYPNSLGNFFLLPTKKAEEKVIEFSNHKHLV